MPLLVKLLFISMFFLQLHGRSTALTHPQETIPNFFVANLENSEPLEPQTISQSNSTGQALSPAMSATASSASSHVNSEDREQEMSPSKNNLRKVVSSNHSKNSTAKKSKTHRNSALGTSSRAPVYPRMSTEPSHLTESTTKSTPKPIVESPEISLDEDEEFDVRAQPNADPGFDEAANPVFRQATTTTTPKSFPESTSAAGSNAFLYVPKHTLLSIVLVGLLASWICL